MIEGKKIERKEYVKALKKVKWLCQDFGLTTGMFSYCSPTGHCI